jgi:Zn-finger protein
LTSTHTHIPSPKVNNANCSGVTEGGYTYAIQYDDGDYEEAVKVRGEWEGGRRFPCTVNCCMPVLFCYMPVLFCLQPEHVRWKELKVGDHVEAMHDVFGQVERKQERDRERERE